MTYSFDEDHHSPIKMLYRNKHIYEFIIIIIIIIENDNVFVDNTKNDIKKKTITKL